MMYASQKKTTVQIEGEDYGIRALSWKSLAKAKEIKDGEQAASLKPYGGEVVAALRSEAVERAAKEREEKLATVEGKRRARYNTYDMGQVLTAGVTSLPVTGSEKLEDRIPDLMEGIARKLFEAIIDFTLGPIDPAEVEAEGKGASGASTGS